MYHNLVPVKLDGWNVFRVPL